MGVGLEGTVIWNPVIVSISLGWKHFEPACSYVLRNLLIHRLLVSIWTTCQSESADVMAQLFAAAMDADAADANPALRQRLRARKVAELLESEHAVVSWLHAVRRTARFAHQYQSLCVVSEALFATAAVITAPLSSYMDRLSLVMVAQSRLRLKRQGLMLPDSRCDMTRAEVIMENKRTLTGDAGWDVIVAYQDLLQASPRDTVWRAELGIRKNDCVAHLLLGIGDAFRRLILAFDCLPYQLFSVIDAEDDEEALQKAEILQQQHCHCKHCKDPLFGEVLPVGSGKVADGSCNFLPLM